MRKLSKCYLSTFCFHGLLGTIIFAAMVPGLAGQNLYEESLSTDSVVAANGTQTTWIGQSFTALSDHTVSSVRLRLSREGNPGNITVAIMACSVHDLGGGYYLHNPSGVPLTQQTFPQSQVNIEAPANGIFEFVLPPYALNGGDVYAVLITSDVINSSNRYLWAQNSWGGYSGGQFVSNLQGLWQGTSTGYPDLVFQIWGTPCSTVPSSTGSGSAGLSSASGSVQNLSALAVPSAGKPGSTAFPDGFFQYEVGEVPPGGSTEITYTGPTDLPVGTQWWKSDGSGTWNSLPIGSDDGDNVITFTLTDNQSPDDGDATPGVILDPGGPGFLLTVEAEFSGTPLSGPAPLTVDFTDESTGATFDTWEWDFEDDGTVDSTAQNPSHTYTIAGTYSVSLTSSSLGASDSETKAEYLTVYSPALADFSGSPLSGLSPLNVSFSSLASGDIDTWEWDFENDGIVDSTAENPSHTYTGAGSYSVSLAVSGPGGTATETKAYYITVDAPAVPPAANFVGTPLSGPVPLHVNFTSLSSGDITSWEWDFDSDGNVDSTDQHPSYTYTTVGTYSVSLTVSGPAGEDTMTQEGIISAQENLNSIPTLNEWGIILLLALLVGTAIWSLRRAEFDR